MTEQTKGILREGEQIEWEDGNLVCVKMGEDKFRLAIKNPKSVLKNKHNSWIYKKEFEFVSKPERYICIVRYSEKSRLINLLSGEFITDEKLYVLEKKGDKSYLAKDLKKNSERLVTLNK